MSDTQLKLPQSRLRAWWQLMRFDRPIGILLLLWPTLWALWAAAGGPPSTQNLVIFLVGVVVMRAAGCVANDLADRDFDPHVERTRERPLAAGTLSPAEARAGCGPSAGHRSAQHHEGNSCFSNLALRGIPGGMRHA